MPFHRVATLDELPPESAIEVVVEGQPYALCRTGGVVHGLGGRCPHAGGPLGQGQLHEGRVVCPYHMWEFECATGEYDYDRQIRVAVAEVKVHNGEIYLQVP
jgi:nitrite reductase (NADH) small subunit